MGVAVSEFAQPGAWEPVQGPPQDLVRQAPYIDTDSSGSGFDPDNVYGLWWQRPSRPCRVFRDSKPTSFTHGYCCTNTALAKML